jgi:hypothetical protein
MQVVAPHQLFISQNACRARDIAPAFALQDAGLCRRAIPVAFSCP